MKVCIDPGHGGYDPGAVGPGGVQEKVITMAVSQKVAGILRSAGINVILTRGTDKLLANSINADLGMRCKVANQAKADVFVSIHCNSAADKSATGTEVFCNKGSVFGHKLAEAIHARLIPALGLHDRGVKQANFAVLRGTDMPATLVELAFISNPTEEGLLEEVAFQDKAAQAIAKGTATYAGITLTKTNTATDAIVWAINAIQAAGIISSPEYWLKNAAPGKQVSGDYVGNLVQKATGKATTTEAIDALQLSNPAYWLEHAVPGKSADGKFVGYLIQKIATNL